MKLIDKDALLNRMQKDPLFDLVERYGVSGVINAEPTVDAVQVIRCKDCKHWETDDNETFCSDWGAYGTGAESYCSFAKRKE